MRLLSTILHLGACEIPGGIGFEVWTQVMHHHWVAWKHVSACLPKATLDTPRTKTRP